MFLEAQTRPMTLKNLSPRSSFLLLFLLLSPPLIRPPTEGAEHCPAARGGGRAPAAVQAPGRRSLCGVLFCEVSSSSCFELRVVGPLLSESELRPWASSSSSSSSFSPLLLLPHPLSFLLIPLPLFSAMPSGAACAAHRLCYRRCRSLCRCLCHGL